MTFLELLRENGVDTKEAGAGGHTRDGWVNFACPFCGGGKHRDSMGYNLQKNYISCYRCGGHSTVSVISRVLDIPFRKAESLLDGVERTRYTERVSKRGKLSIPKGVKPMADPHREYLRSRGFNPEEIERIWNVQGIGLAVKYSHRLFIPIEYQGEVVSWTTRSIRDDADMRYISAPEEDEALNHKELLYGDDKAQHAICVVEGPTDAWAIGPGTIATCGTAISRAQMLRMSRYPVIGVCLDNQVPAQRRAKQLVDDLCCFGGKVVNFVLDAKDAAEAPKRDILSIRKELGL